MNLKDIEKRLRTRTETEADINYIYDTLSALNELKQLHKANTELQRIEKAHERKDKYKGNEVLTNVKSILKTAYNRYTMDKNQRDDVWQNECLVMDIHGLEIGDFLKPYYVTNEGVESIRKDSYSETLNELAKAINQRKVFEVQQEYNKRKNEINNKG